MNLLHTIGLMTRAEHERLMSNRVSIAIHNDVVNEFRKQLANKDAKFKRAATDLAAQSVKAADLAVEVEKLRTELVARKRLAVLQGAVMEKLRPDAEAMRKKRAADRKRMAGKRGKA